MALEMAKIPYSGRIREITLGKADKAIKVGGETSYPFHTFEGEMPNRPKIALEVWDVAPSDWPDTLLESYGEVLSDPVAWAKKGLTEIGADLISLNLVSTDPNGMNRGAKEAVGVAKRLVESLQGLPLIIWGSGNDQKDGEVLRLAAEELQGHDVILGPVQEKNYKQIGAGAIAYGDYIIASTPIDINLAKQLNVLLGNLGISDDRILMDPTTGALGYGLEYTYSVMERDRMAALTQEDVKLQLPLVCNLGFEVWKTKETRLKDDPLLGDPANRGILIEAVTAMVLLLAGVDILIMRHPKAIGLIKEALSELCT